MTPWLPSESAAEYSSRSYLIALGITFAAVLSAIVDAQSGRLKEPKPKPKPTPSPIARAQPATHFQRSPSSNHSHLATQREASDHVDPATSYVSRQIWFRFRPR